jgi:Ca-activated chloride channel family protein
LDRPDFAHPERLLLLIGVAALGGLWLALRRRRSIEQLAYGLAGAVDWKRPALSLAGLACLVVALAQPRWGRTDAPPSSPGHDVVLAVDVSRSMGAEDAVPDRLGLAAAAARDLLARLRERPGNRAALVAFAGRAALRVPLTEDIQAIVDALDQLRPGDIRPGGTNFATALEAAADAFDDERPDEGRAVIVFSDGEDHEGTWSAFVPMLKERGIIVHAVAVGDEQEAASVPSGRDGPLKYQGEEVKSRRVDAALKAIARETGGAFVPLGTASGAGLGDLYRDRIAPVARARALAAGPSERAERFGPLLLLGAFLMLAAEWPARRWSLARGPVVVAALAIGLLAAGPQSDTPAGRTHAGRDAYTRGDFAAALATFDEAARLAPDSPLPAFDAAACLYRLGRFDEADARYHEARDRADEATRPLVDYALGNTALARGAVAEAIAHYDRCLDSARDPALRRDAEINRQFAVEHLPPADGREDDGAAQRANSDDRPPPGRDADEGPQSRSAGGGRNERPTPNRAAPSNESPETQLERAIERIKRARGRESRDPPAPADPNRKDW